MRSRHAAGGWFRRLWPGDEAALLAHYRRLSADDLRLRFLHAAGDAFLERHARRLGEPGYHVIGWFRDGALRAVGEIATEGNAAEAAFSVEAGWRRLGVGRALMRRALRRARLAGCATLRVYTARDNAAMTRLARAFGGRLSVVGTDIVAELIPAPAGLPALGLDALEDWLGLTGAAGALLRLPWPARPPGFRAA